jgi:hypothetical protein
LGLAEARLRMRHSFRHRLTRSYRRSTELEDPYHALPSLLINGVEQDVREGTGAVRAYEAMMYGVERTDELARSAWRELLLQYCKLDTLSMVLVFEHWRRATGLATIPDYSPMRAPSSTPTSAQ